MAKFFDGLKDIYSGVMNRRNSVNRSVVSHTQLSIEDMRVMYKSGLMSKVFRLKVGYAFNDSLKFDSTEDKVIFDNRLLEPCKIASKFMLGFGRGIIVVFNKEDDLSKPLRNPNLSTIQIRSFSGDMVTSGTPFNDLRNERYYKPQYYNVRGKEIHHSRVVDFTYFAPPELEAPNYMYGGISESELVYAQFVNDEVVQRATGNIVDKASTFVYKIKGYKDLIANKKDSDLVQFISNSEDTRSGFGALIVDADDMVEVLNQSISDLDKVNNITLQRVAMVTGIGMTDLIGEQPGGLGANGTDERASTQDTIKNLQSDYLLSPINQLAAIFGLGRVEFKDEQMLTATQKAAYDNQVATTAKLLWEMGEDAAAYLKDKGIIKANDWDDFWKKKESSESNLLEEFKGAPDAEGASLPDDKSVAQLSMNGAQVSAMKEIIADVTSGVMPKETAIKTMKMAFPVDKAAVVDLLSDIKVTNNQGEDDASEGNTGS